MSAGVSYLAGKIRWIGRTWRPHLRWLPVLLCMTFVSTAVTLAYPLVFGYVLEQIRQLGAQETAAVGLDTEVRRLIGILLAIGLARFLASFYPAFRAWVNSRIELLTRERFFSIVLRKGYRFFTQFRTGDVVTRLTDDIAGYPKIAWFCCSGLFRALDSASRVVCCLAVMVWLDWALALYSLIPVPLMIGFFLALNRSLGRAALAQRAAASETSDFLEASFSGVSVLQAHNAEARLGDALARKLELRSEAEVRLARLWVMFSIFFQALNVVGQLVVVVVGGLWVIDGTLSLGTFFSFYLYLGLLLGPMMDLPNLFVTARQAFVCMERLEEMAAFDPERELDADRGDAPLESIEEVSLQGVSYAYARKAEDGRSHVRVETLKAVDLRVERGERVAIVGEIGAGKTTLVRALAGVLPPQEGAVLLNGRPVTDYQGPAFRRAIGFVPQDPVLFAATVRENVVLGREEDPDRLARALAFAGMTQEVEALPEGLDHSLGLRGRGLSGGQRQRLTIARALYGDPQLLLLDDITAALDAENEERFWERVFQAWPEATVIVVTHRAATARRMQRALTLDRGRIVTPAAAQA